MDNKIKQLRKGILELAILGCLHNESHYGYSLIRSISLESQIDLTEGTIYPILGRLAREKLIGSEWVESKQGPPRKYYSLTSKGKEAYDVLSREFKSLSEMVASTEKGIMRASDDLDKKIIPVKKESGKDE
jgi:PadR family transcriptional regulator PadR